MKRVLLFLCAFFLILSIRTGLAAGDIKAGEQKSQVCAACHGADGNSSNPVWPNLAGQGEGYLISQLHFFRNGERENAQMSPMAANLSDQDIEDLAAWYSTRKGRIGQTPPEYVVSGEKVYRAGNADTGVPACMACHGPAGEGNAPAQYPALSGQHAAYVETQLNAYRAGTRVNMIMRTIANKMSAEEIKAVSEYVQGLH
jgi:cytochrome c553